MKRVLIILVACIFLISMLLPVSAAETKGTKIAFVDMNKVLQESKSGMDALKTFNAFAMAKKDMIMAKAKEINDLETDLIQKSSAMNEAAKRKKQDQILDLKRNVQKMQDDAQNEVMEKQAQLIEPIYKELKALLETIAKEEGYAAIMQMTEVLPLHHHRPTPDGNSVIVPDVRVLMLYVSDDADITKLVLQRYNSGKKSK
jgi:outer membrane protein